MARESEKVHIYPDSFVEKNQQIIDVLNNNVMAITTVFEGVKKERKIANGKLNIPFYEYTNGNYDVTLMNNGTKIRKTNDKHFNPVYPESIDVKITNYCDLGCKFCHEDSTKKGKHSELYSLLDLVKDCPAGVELAIGGGNPLSHPDFEFVMGELVARGIVVNVTVNQEHLLDTEYFNLLRRMISNGYISGLGISITDTFDTRVINEIRILNKLTTNIVFHVIIGVNKVSVLEKLEKLIPNYKVLVLGYKIFRRGNYFYSVRCDNIDKNIKQWYMFICRHFKKDNIISFDNLAITQLNIKRFFFDNWDSFYMGDDGKFTFYIDLVNKKFASSSVSETIYDLLSTNIEMFDVIKKQKVLS